MAYDLQASNDYYIVKFHRDVTFSGSCLFHETAASNKDYFKVFPYEIS